jgi:hypothetical protein
MRVVKESLKIKFGHELQTASSSSCAELQITGKSVNPAADLFTINYYTHRIYVPMLQWLWFELDANSNSQVTVCGHMKPNIGKLHSKSIPT